MDLKVNLEDDNLCAGCPFNAPGKECKGGFKRDIAILVERTDIAYNYYGEEVHDTVLNYMKVRPMECIVANERADRSATVLDSSERKLINQAARRGATRPACVKCRKVHPNYESCYGKKR